MENTNKIQFDPNKSYSWEAKEKFELNGQQFQLLNHMLTEKLKKFELPENQELILEYEAFKVMQSLLQKAVEDGNAHEVNNTKNPS